MCSCFPSSHRSCRRVVLTCVTRHRNFFLFRFISPYATISVTTLIFQFLHRRACTPFFDVIYFLAYQRTEDWFVQCRYLSHSLGLDVVSSGDIPTELFGRIFLQPYCAKAFNVQAEGDILQGSINEVAAIVGDLLVDIYLLMAKYKAETNISFF